MNVALRTRLQFTIGFCGGGVGGHSTANPNNEGDGLDPCSGLKGWTKGIGRTLDFSLVYIGIGG